MTAAQNDLLLHSADSIAAAKLMMSDPLYAGFAASRAYYAMFYAGQAIMLTLNMSFKKHSSVIAAFGKEFAKSGKLPKELHRNFVIAEKRRLTGDYDTRNAVTVEQAKESVQFAEEFLAAITTYLNAQP